MLVLALSRWPGLLPPNFSAVYAIAFCAGVYFPGVMAWWLPLATFLVTDVLISLFFYDGQGADSVGHFLLKQSGNYVGYLVLISLGRSLGAKRSWLTLVLGGVLGSILFYLVTNAASWLILPYPRTLLGLLRAMTTGLPDWPTTLEMFRNTLLGGGLFTGMFVAVAKISAAAESPREKEAPAPAAEPVPADDEPEEAKA